MKNHFSAREYNGLCNICFLVSRDNSSIGMRLPRIYLDDYRTHGAKLFHRVMRSHLIPAGPDSGVWVSGIVDAFKKFRRERLRMICNAFEREAGIRLFSRT